jgi:predicted nucleotidyltransferase
MKIDRSTRIAGHDIKRVRDFLRNIDNRSWTATAIAEHFKIESADTLIAELIRLGYLERDEPFHSETDVWYSHGLNAARLINVRFLKRINRDRADELVAGFLQRVREVNASTYFLYVVAEVRAFGSYIDPSKCDFGDIDIAIHLERRPLEISDDGFVERALKRATDSGRHFSNFGQQLFFAQHEVLQFLKARKSHLSLHEMDDLTKIGAKSVILFSYVGSLATDRVSSVH